MTTKAETRGFVIIVILAATAVIAAVVAGQLLSGQKAQVAGLRTSEEVRARAIAEACLDMMTAYATASVPNPPNPGDDFDLLLAGPDGVLATADDFLPQAAPQVTIPPSAGPSQESAWALLAVPGTGGACAVRFDDNSDDGRSALPGALDDPGEGTGPDVVNMDRDLSVYVTAIGLYPAVDTDPAAYVRAHARITLRRLVQLTNVFQPLAPALWANLIDLQNNNDICGAGGAVASDISMSNNSCICGTVQATTTGGANPPASGDVCTCPTSQCPPATVATVAIPPVPPVNVHWGNVGVMLANEGFGAALEIDPVGNPAPTPSGEGSIWSDPATTNDIVNGDTCVFYGKSGGELFIWDKSDNNARATLEDLAGAPPGPLVLGNAPVALPNISGASVTDCTSLVADPFPEPCTWPTNATANATFDPNAINCTALQSPCWKLIHRLDDGVVGSEVGFGPGTMVEWVGSPSGNQLEAQRSGGSDGGDLPNVKIAITTAGLGGGVAFGPGGMCGTAASSCSSCPTGGGPNFRATLEHHGGDHWHFKTSSDSRYLPEPAIWLLEVAGNRVAVEEMGGNGTGPYQATIISSNDIDFDSGASICCATCDCSAAGASTAPGSCDAGGPISGGGAGDAMTNALRAINAPPGSPTLTAGDPASPLLSRGTALKAAGTIDLDGDMVVGDVRAGVITIDDICLIGNAVAHGVGSCSGSCNVTSGMDANICLDNNANIVGDVESMRSIDSGAGNNAMIWGSVVAKGDVCFKNNASIDGILMAGATIELKNNAYIVNTSTSALGAPQAANAALRTFMESGW